jgi:Flp pilus assembly protein TadG
MTRRDDRGSAVVELVALIPIYMMFIVAVVFVGKLNNSSANIEEAARSAARTISIDRDPEGAVEKAHDVARRMAHEGSAFCTQMTFQAPIQAPTAAEPGEVTVTITCQVNLQEATLIHLPGTRTMTATATEVIDMFRENN